MVYLVLVIVVNCVVVVVFVVDKLQVYFVVDNVVLFVEVDYDWGVLFCVIMVGDMFVGFLMYDVFDWDDVWFYCFMIDVLQQGWGYGCVGLQVFLVEIVVFGDVICIFICYEFENEVVCSFYVKVGFVEEGLDEDDEMIVVFDLCVICL